MVREEAQRDKLRGRTGERAWRWEERLEEGRGNDIARRCLEEMKERCRGSKVFSEWEVERKEFFEGRGIRVEEVEKWRDGGTGWFRELKEREKNLQKEKKWEKIRKSKYNRCYGRMKGEGMSNYLSKG